MHKSKIRGMVIVWREGALLNELLHDGNEPLARDVGTAVDLELICSGFLPCSMSSSDNPAAEHNPVEPPPCKQPLEVRSRGEEWIVREYYPQSDRPDDGGTVSATCDTRLEALRAGQETMDSNRYPCLLRWESNTSVGGLYWNSVFERLSVEFSDLLQAWVVVPAGGHYVFQTAESTDAAYKIGNTVLEQYDFKTVQFVSRDGNVEAEREHRFLRHNITAPGVTLRSDS